MYLKYKDIHFFPFLKKDNNFNILSYFLDKHVVKIDGTFLYLFKKKTCVRIDEYPGVN